MAKVGDITLRKDIWGARDVFSKCLIVPSEIRDKTSPLPDEVLKAAAGDSMEKEYATIMGSDFLTWNVHSLLVPSPEVLVEMCKDYPIAESSQFGLTDVESSDESSTVSDESDRSISDESDDL